MQIISGNAEGHHLTLISESKHTFVLSIFRHITLQRLFWSNTGKPGLLEFHFTQVTLYSNFTGIIMSDLLFVEVDSVMMHATSITTTSRMLPVLACEESR